MFSSVAFGVMEQVYTPIFVAWCYRNWQMCIYIDIIGVARSAVVVTARLKVFMH